MPQGKPAGVRCVHLTDQNLCGIWQQPDRPAVCASLRPAEEMCGRTAHEAFVRLAFLEWATAPAGRA
jgi:hypothetical protein